MINLSIPLAGNYYIPSKCKLDVAVDIGANSGIVTKELAKRFKIVYSYEPIYFLYEKIKNYNLPNVMVYNEAVSNKVGQTSVISHFNNDSGSCAIKECIDDVIVKKHWTNNQVNKVNTIDLKTVLDRCGGRINFLKMDCENSEFLILNNNDLSMIDYIGIEVHNQMGEDNFNKLKDWVSITHEGFPTWTNDNQEVLLVNRNNL